MSVDQAILDFSKRSAGEFEETCELPRPEPIKSFGGVPTRRRNRIADLIALFEVPRGGARVNKCQDLVPKLVCELPDNQLAEVVYAHALKRRHIPFRRTRNREP